MARPSQPRVCCSSICRRPISPGEKAVGVTLFAQTVGMGPQRTTKSQRLFLCPQCAIRNATGKMPSPLDPVELAFFKIVLDLAGHWREVTEAAFSQLAQRREDVLYPLALPETIEAEVLPPLRRLKDAS